MQYAPHFGPLKALQARHPHPEGMIELALRHTGPPQCDINAGILRSQRQGTDPGLHGVGRVEIEATQLYSSAYPRAIQTAEASARVLGTTFAAIRDSLGSCFCLWTGGLEVSGKGETVRVPSGAMITDFCSSLITSTRGCRAASAMAGSASPRAANSSVWTMSRPWSECAEGPAAT